MFHLLSAYPVELSAKMEMLILRCPNSTALANVVVEHLKVINATEELNFEWHLILIHLNLSLDSGMWLVATVFDRPSLQFTYTLL